MMLRFSWDSLQRGDRFLAGDVAAHDLGPRPAVVVRPGRFATRSDPVETDAESLAVRRSAGGLGSAPESSR